MELILATGDAGIIDAFTRYFPQVRVINQPDIRELDAWAYDSVLLMGNSYGIFEEAHNQLINEIHPNTEFWLRMAITDEFGGMLPVGAATVGSLTDDIHMPGMAIFVPYARLPGSLPDPSAIYWAARAGFFAARQFSTEGEIKQLLIHPYGLEYLPLMSVVAQFRLAYEHVFESGVDTSDWNTIGQTESMIAVAVGTH